MISVVLPALTRVKALSHNKWESASLISAVKCPILFLSGQRDELVPPSMTQRLYALATNSSKKTMELFPTGQHNTTWCCGGYYDALVRWVRAHNLTGEARL